MRPEHTAARSGAPSTGSHVGRALPFVQAGAGALLILAATALPWVSYSVGRPTLTSSFHGGSMGVFLAVIGAAAIVFGLVAASRRVTWVLGTSLGIGAIAFIGSAALALSKMADANSLHVTGPSQTSYAIGTAVGLVASLAIVLTALIGLTGRGPSAR